MKLRVLVVSNVQVVREGLNSILAQRGVDVVSTVDLPHAGDRSAQLHPDVTLFDAARQDSVEFVKDLVASAPHSKVVAFGVKETDEEILALAAAGTAGYVRESAESGDVVRVLEQVMCDELPCSPRAAASLYRHVAVLSQGGNDPVARAADRASDRLRAHEQADRPPAGNRSRNGQEPRPQPVRETQGTPARRSSRAHPRHLARARGVARFGAGCASDARSELTIRRSEESPCRQRHRRPCRPPLPSLDRPGPIAGHGDSLRAVRTSSKPQGEALGCWHARQLRHTRATA